MKHNIGTRTRGIGGKGLIKKLPSTDPSCQTTPDSSNLVITPQEIITICKCKHYRYTGIQAVMNYNRLQELLKRLGLNEEQIKQCMHP